MKGIDLASSPRYFDSAASAEASALRGKGAEIMKRDWFWKDMVGARIAADYYTHLANGYVAAQRGVNSGAAFLCILDVVARCYAFVSYDVSTGKTAFSGLLLVVGLNYNASGKAAEASLMQASWNRLADDFENVWDRSNEGTEFDREAVLELQRRHCDLSTQGSTLSCAPMAWRRKRRMREAADRMGPRYVPHSEDEKKNQGRREGEPQ